MNICSICNSAPATVYMSSYDIDKFCDPCRYKKAMVDALARKWRKK